MIIGIDPSKAPLRKYQSDHLKQIKYRELAANLESRGVKIVHVGATAIRVNLRGLLQSAGTLQAAQREIMTVLHELGADSVNIEAEDVEYLSGRDVMSHAIARGLEAGVKPLEAILQDIPLTEDGDGQDVVPIFDRLDRAAHFIATDQTPAGADEELLRRGAEADLHRAGLLDRVDSTYRDFLEPAKETLPELPPEFRTGPRPYRSIWDREQ
jgi:hypothetical protein